MNLQCFFGRHAWSGCMCSICSKTRDKDHDWSKDCEKCATCSNTRENGHDWGIDCEKCSRCKKLRSNSHLWNGCTCFKCDKRRDENHNWEGCKCKTCGKAHDKNHICHIWNGCRCSVCGTTRDEGHYWSKNCEKCFYCGVERQGMHNWNHCICALCGTNDAAKHVVKNCKCQQCGITVHTLPDCVHEFFFLNSKGLGGKVLAANSADGCDAITSMAISVGLSAKMKDKTFLVANLQDMIAIYEDHISSMALVRSATSIQFSNRGYASLSDCEGCRVGNQWDGMNASFEIRRLTDKQYAIILIKSETWENRAEV